MREEIEKLIEDYRAIINQSHLMQTAVSDPFDKGKIEGGRLSVELTIEHLEEILNSK